MAARKIIVTGGNGYVGGAVCRAALANGYTVTSVNRSGAPSLKEQWVNEVNWVQGDALHPEAWQDLFKDAKGVVSCVGVFGRNATMKEVCGTANVRTAEAAYNAGVERFVFISSHDFKIPFFLSGYFEGKWQAEEAIRRLFKENGACIRPGFIYGDKPAGEKKIPLGVIGKPLSFVTQMLPKQLTTLPIISAGLLPPVPVEGVANTAIQFINGKIQPEKETRIFSVHDILRYSS